VNTMESRAEDLFQVCSMDVLIKVHGRHVRSSIAAGLLCVWCHAVDPHGVVHRPGRQLTTTRRQLHR
jgi:hypothetical protein